MFFLYSILISCIIKGTKNKQDFCLKNNKTKGLLSMLEVIIKSNEFKVKKGMEDAFESLLNQISSEGEFLYNRDEKDVFSFASQGDLYLEDEDGESIYNDDVLEKLLPFVSEDEPIIILEVDYEELLHTNAYLTRITSKGMDFKRIDDLAQICFTN